MLRAAALALLLVACNSHKAKVEPTPTGSQTASASGVPAVGAKAPDATVVKPSGEKLALADYFGSHDKTVLVFYRGFY
jgi:hypothetical protein